MNSLFLKENEITPANLKEAIQQAIEIEIATIPVYLYTYYTINRSPDQDAISGQLAQALVRAGQTQEQANETALNMSADLVVFANKAGALIMSVAVEEMLHMALSSNLKQALAGLPELVGKTPDQWPAFLPGHQPEFPINRAKLSLRQLMTFLKIESPDPLPEQMLAMGALPYRTIGQFYDMIRSVILKNDLPYNTHSPQLIPGKGYYAQNNIDTIYYNKDQHRPVFVNADDSGDLIYVQDRGSAVKAINTIVEQGEGNPDAPGLLPDGTVDCAIVKADFDDKTQKELSHFAKFSQIYCQYQDLSNRFNDLGIGDIDISNYFVANVPVNPSTTDYPANIQPVSNLVNAVYTYIFVMTEGCYKKSGNTQYEIFMFGIHKSMIFILNSLCGDIMQLTYTDHNGDTKTVAPTFEDYPFGLLDSPKSQLIDLYNQAVAVYPAISYLEQRFHDLPDVAL